MEFYVITEGIEQNFKGMYMPFHKVFTTYPMDIWYLSSDNVWWYLSGSIIMTT